jgi:SAM-dependent methyltransferase
MPTLRQLRSFYRRRIAVPVDADSLVLDVGSGDKPHWRADVLVDRFPEAEHAIQRSGSSAALTPRPLFDADVTDMPFADKAFDFVICSHLLEHVLDPAAAIDEMVRVGKAGYIEVPRAAMSKIMDFPSHLWWCRDEAGVLTFEAKRTRAFDAEIESFVRRPVMEREINALIDRHFDDCVIGVPWTGSVRYRVEGAVDPLLVHEVAASDVGHREAATAATRVLTAAFTAPLRSKRRRAPVMFDDIVKPELRTGTPHVLEQRRYDTALGHLR